MKMKRKRKMREGEEEENEQMRERVNNGCETENTSQRVKNRASYIPNKRTSILHLAAGRRADESSDQSASSVGTGASRDPYDGTPRYGVWCGPDGSFSRSQSGIAPGPCSRTLPVGELISLFGE